MRSSQHPQIMHAYGRECVLLELCTCTCELHDEFVFSLSFSLFNLQFVWHWMSFERLTSKYTNFAYIQGQKNYQITLSKLNSFILSFLINVRKKKFSFQLKKNSLITNMQKAWKYDSWSVCFATYALRVKSYWFHPRHQP